MQRRKHAFRDRCNEIASVQMKHEIWTLIKQKTSENVRQKNVQQKKFPELTAQKAKIEKIKIRTWNSALLIK